LQVLLVPPPMMAVRMGVFPAFQSPDAWVRRADQALVVRLLPSFRVNWGVVRAQW